MGEETTEPDSTEDLPAEDAAGEAGAPADPESDDAEAESAEADDADADDAEADDAEAVEAKPIDAEPVEAEAVDAEPIDAEPVEAEPIDAEPIEAEQNDSQPEAARPDGTEHDGAEHDGAELDRALWDPIASAALLRTQPQFDETVLDAWCGDGAAALPTAALVGPGGRVDAIDADEDLVAAARGRGGAHLPQLHVQVADPGDWATSGYDLVQCVLGLASCGSPDSAARHLASLVKPGGRLVLSLWAHGAFGPLDEIAREALAAERGTPDEPSADEPSTDEPSAHEPSTDEPSADAALPGTAGTLAALMHELGLVDVRAEHVERHLELTDDLAWQLVAGARRVPADVLGTLDADALDRVKQRFDTAVAERGVTRVDVSTLIAAGRRPA